MERFEEDSIHVKYLVVNALDKEWGLFVNSVGYQHIEKGAAYPPANHPMRYLFSTERGRVLDEYQLLYITRGKGYFRSAHCPECAVDEGRMFLLFPGEWHSYHPDPTTGWDEYWIGFNGINMTAREDAGFFTKEHPLYHIGLQEMLVKMYLQAIDVARRQDSGFQQLLASIVNYLIGYAYLTDKQASFGERKWVTQINKAKLLMSENISSDISFEQLAGNLNMSYSSFRKLFKQYTGFSPNQYFIEIKMQKIKEMLTNTEWDVMEIAYRMGFSDPNYFCTLFKRKTGFTPANYRRSTRMMH